MKNFKNKINSFLAKKDNVAVICLCGGVGLLLWAVLTFVGLF